MPRLAKELGALEVSRLIEPGYHAVGGVAGLCLQVAPPPSIAKTWVLRVTVGGKRREIGLGAYSSSGMTLALARKAAIEVRDKVKAGIDPIGERKAAKSAAAADRAAAITFQEAAAAYIAAKEPEWKNAKHGQQWRNTLAQHADPVLGKLLVRDIGQVHVLKVLEPIWTTTTETASRLRGRIENVLDWATTKGYRQGDNPARWKGHLDKLLPAPTKVKTINHHPALDYRSVGNFIADLHSMEGIGPRALEFVILTAARSGEVRGATWDEIDIGEKVWTIPPGRMKARKEHRVPLSPSAIKLLEALPRIGESNLLFPNGGDGQLSDMTLTAILRRMGRGDITVHGFRSTFRDWAGETTAYPREVIEHAMAHQLKDKAEAAYARGTLFDKRRRLMGDWATFCGKVSGVAKVTPLRGRTA